MRTRAPEQIPWRQLCAIAATERQQADSYSEWQGRIVDTVIAQGYRVEPITLHRAIQSSAQAAIRTKDQKARWLWTQAPLSKPPSQLPAPMPDPTIQPHGRRSEAWTQPARLLKPSIVCGASKTTSGPALTCTQAAGHEGDHGMALRPGGVIFVRWARG
jgi:hypothetical protein